MSSSRRRTNAKAVVPAALTLALSACGGVEVRGESGDGAAPEGGSSGPIELAVLPKAVGADYWTAVKEGAECAADKAGDVTVQWTGVTTETDVAGQITLVQDFVTKGVDGIVYAATDSEALAPATQAAVDAGIPVAMIDSGTSPQPEGVPLYATDNVAAAEQVADLLAEALGEGEHQVALVEFQPGSQTNQERVEGFLSGLRNHPNLKLVAQQPSNSDVNVARRVTEDILTANPDITGIFAANEPSVIGAVQAVEAAGLGGKVKIVGWDAAPDEIAALERGTVTALVVQHPFKMGYLGVQNTVTAIREDEPMESADTGVTFVTANNLHSDEVQAVLEPSCANPPVG